MRFILFVVYVVVISLIPVKSDAQILNTDSIQVLSGSQIYSDNLSNVYVVSPANDIIKYSKSGVKLATANIKILGNISYLDASNPFEIYVFYRDQNKIVFLDNLLNIRGECDMEAIGVSQIACIARSSDNQIWLFDMADLKLKKYSKDLKLVLESAAFNTLPMGDLINPAQIIDINSSIVILNNNSIFEFDLFANYSKVVLKDTIKSFQVLNNKIVYTKNGKIEIFNKLNFRSEVMNIEILEQFEAFRLEKERLFILKGEYVILHTISE